MRTFLVEIFKEYNKNYISLGEFRISLEKRILVDIKPVETPTITEINQPDYKTFNSKEDMNGLLCVEVSNNEVNFLTYLEGDLVKVQPLWSVDAIADLIEVHKMVKEYRVTIKDAIEVLHL